MKGTDPRELVTGFFDRVWNRGDFGYLDRHYSPDALWHDAAAGDASGPEVAKQIIGRWREAFPDITVTIQEQFVEGDVVVTRHRSDDAPERLTASRRRAGAARSRA
jgi:hypothetical protein